MTKNVPYLNQHQIERDALALLTEYALPRGVVVRPPVPIEDMIEKHLRIGIEFDDMHEVLGVPRSSAGPNPDILGAMFFDERRIVVD